MNRIKYKFEQRENFTLTGPAYVTAHSGHQTYRDLKKAQCVWSLDMKKYLARFAKDESGATAIEYGLIAAGVSIAIIAAVRLAGDNLTTTWDEIADNLVR